MKSQINDQQGRELIAELAEVLPMALEHQIVSPPDNPSDVVLSEVTRRKSDPVFTGGGIVGLLITDPAAPSPSRTKDIDLVLGIANYAEFERMGEMLRKAGFRQDGSSNESIESWRWKEIRVDFLPHRPIGGMQANRWFPFLMEEAKCVEVVSGKFAWCASAPCFIATKFEAFFSRGNGDYLLSKDIEDILAVIDGRAEFLNEINVCAHEVRDFVTHCCRCLLADERFMDCLQQLIPDDQREAIVTNRLLQLVRTA